MCASPTRRSRSSTRARGSRAMPVRPTGAATPRLPITCRAPIAGIFFEAEDGIRGDLVTVVQTCALPICTLWAIPVCGEFHPPQVDETRHKQESPIKYARRVARDKARAVSQRNPDAIVLGADTIVVVRSEERRVGKERRDQRVLDRERKKW